MGPIQQYPMSCCSSWECALEEMRELGPQPQVSEKQILNFLRKLLLLE